MSMRRILDGLFLAPTFAKMYTRRAVAYLRGIAAPARKRFSNPTSQKRLIQFIVCLALLLDNMLYMVIVPIIDDYFDVPVATTEAIDINTSTTAEAKVFTTIDPLNQSSFATGSEKSMLLSPTGKTKTHFLGTLEHGLEKLKPVKIQDRKDGMMGLLFASKAIVQLCINPFTGAFIDRVGYITPLTMGLLVMFISTSVFAVAESYACLFVARSLQGVGSALADTASFGLIADRFQNEGERSKALGIALAFISFGSLVAPPFGGILYEFVGRPVPFVLLAITCLFDASLLLLVEVPSDDEEQAKDGGAVGTPIYKLLMDPYILIIAGSLTIANFPLAFLEPTIAEWMQDTMDAHPWQIGLIWLPPFLPHVLGVALTVMLSVKYFRFQWLYGAIGLVLIGLPTIVVAACRSFVALIIPLSVMCFGIALIDTALLPTLAFLVDVRHTSVYGSVYAIADISYSVAYALGPVLAGQAVQYLGYAKMNVLIGLANVFFAPVLFALRKVYDWNVDRTERDMLLPNGDPNSNQMNHANGNLVNLSGKVRSDFVEEISDGDGGGDTDSPGEKLQLRGPEWNSMNYNTSTNQDISNVVPTSVKPRPRPRPRRVSTEINPAPEHDSSNLARNGRALSIEDGDF